MPNVYLIADDCFFPGLRAAIYTLRQHHSEWNLFILHHDKLSPLSVSNRSLIAAQWPTVRFYNCSHQYRWSWGIQNKQRLISLLKFEVFRLSKGALSIYLDTDVLVLRSLNGAVKMLLDSNAPLCAVENRSFSRTFHEWEAKVFPANAGFFILNPNRLDCEHAHQLAQSIIDRDLASLRSGRPMVCQPIFNEVISKVAPRYLAAPMFYNFRRLDLYELFQDDIALLHFVTRTSDVMKPWDAPQSRDPATNVWWREYRDAQEQFQ